MVANGVGEVVGELEQVLIEAIGLAEPTDAGPDLIPSPKIKRNLGERGVLYVPLIPDAGVDEPCLVEDVVFEAAVELGREGILAALEDVLPVGKAEAAFTPASR